MMPMSVRRRLGLAALALAVPLVFLACEEDETAGTEPTQIGLRIVTTTPAPTPEPTLPPVVVTATPAPTPVPNVCPETPRPAEPNVMVVDEPQPDARLPSPAPVR